MNNDSEKINKLDSEYSAAKIDSSVASCNLSNTLRLYIDEKNAELRAMF
jgi:hypothetical protein